MSESTTDILAHAIEWARAGGTLARERLGSTTVSQKVDRTPVTDADHAVQALIVDAIARHYPGHAVLTEETLERPERHVPADVARWCWVIDPIDGTRNYARGLAPFATCVAVLCEGAPEIGVVYDVMSDRTYWAQAGGGAWCDRVRLRTADNPPSGDTLVGAPAGNGNPLPRLIHNWLDQTTMRNLGTTALHLAMVASGAMDASICYGSNLWDVAAGALLVMEAGGVVTDLRGQPIFPVPPDRRVHPVKTPYLAAGPNLHAALLQSVQA